MLFKSWKCLKIHWQFNFQDVKHTQMTHMYIIVKFHRVYINVFSILLYFTVSKRKMSNYDKYCNTCIHMLYCVKQTNVSSFIPRLHAINVHLHCMFFCHRLFQMSQLFNYLYCHQKVKYICYIKCLKFDNLNFRYV